MAQSCLLTSQPCILPWLRGRAAPVHRPPPPPRGLPPRHTQCSPHSTRSQQARSHRAYAPASAEGAWRRRGRRRLAAGTWAGCRGRFLVVGMSVCPFVVWVVNGCVVSLRGGVLKGCRGPLATWTRVFSRRRRMSERRARGPFGRSIDRPAPEQSSRQAGKVVESSMECVLVAVVARKSQRQEKRKHTQSKGSVCDGWRGGRGALSSWERMLKLRGSTGFLVVCRSRVSGLVCAPPRFTSQGGPRTATQACRPGAGLLFSGRLGLAVVGEPSKSTKLGAPAARSQHTLRPAPPPPKNTRTHALAVAVRPGYSLVFFIRVGRGGVLRLRPSALRPLRHCLDLKPADS